MERENECEFFEGVAGDDLYIPFQLIDENGNPVKIGTGDGMSDISGQFTSADGALVEVKYTDTPPHVALVDSTCGRGALIVPAATSATLKTSKVKKQTFAIVLTKNSLKTTWPIENGMLLKPRPVPAA